MQEEHLRKVISDASPQERVRWYQLQLLLAQALRNDLLRRTGNLSTKDSSPIEIPEVHEIVSETIIRIRDRHNERYVWDCVTPPTFNKFFAQCLKTTINSLRAQERAHRAGHEKLEPLVRAIMPTPHELLSRADDALAQKESKPVLASMIAKTRMFGKVKDYADRLPHYAEEKLTSAEIADDLGVKRGTVDSFRKRVRKVLDDPDQN